MRHLDQTNDVPIDQEDLKKIIEIKEELSDFNLEDCDRLMKNNFHSDDESFNDIELPLSPSSPSSVYEISLKSVIPRKHRRKALQPQKAVHSEVSQGSSVGTSSECSQDASDRSFLNLLSAENIFNIKTDLLMSDNENEIELPESEDLLRDIDEENIFKGLQEETNGEKLDEEIIDNVKEEWRSHWGVKCNMCEQVFPFKMEFDRHYRDNYGITPVYTCSFCNKSAEKYSTFRSHCYRHITEGRYKCQDCDKGFSLQSMLHVHILSRHTKAKPFACDICGKSFVTKPGLRIHSKKHNVEAKEDYPCVECGKVLHTRGGLTSHMNVHRLGRRFMCDVCGKTFTQKVNMQQHVKQHTGDKPHRCDKCGKTFAEKSHLARHYSFHSNVRPFKCDVCQKMYKTERCLKVHSLVHAAARPFVCTYCNKGFLSSTKLKQHHNVHTGERPYACKYCDRTFTNYPNWLKHTRRRHKVDHKTGEYLPSNTSKEIPIPYTSPPSELSQSLDATDPLMIDLATLSKTDELFLQQGLINLPTTFEERFMLPHQLDLLNGSSNSGLLGPFVHMQLPNFQTVMPQSPQSSNSQFNDLLQSSLI
ncbi:hypothetical protein PPYR_04191 [Photinus pyralis]|uniref:C2H2-type domain-containing protein n=1 Tax=Photinus pyralis TaxID=7054 RepID=A0A5N4AXA9_PHOPY|nr:zinc finger protein 2 homolog [Photinus pyralis]KAB0802005.1 hypothetical protein PPYR_04191 [Photinus pyralis]